MIANYGSFTSLVSLYHDAGTIEADYGSFTSLYALRGDIGTTGTPGVAHIHDGGTITMHDDGNDTSFVWGPVVDDTTTLAGTGSLNISGNVAGATYGTNGLIDNIELELLNGMASVSTGTGDNDKLVTKGYVDDSVSSSGGSDTQVQFNDGGAFGGDAGMVYNKTTNVLTVEDISSESNTIAGAVEISPMSTTGPRLNIAAGDVVDTFTPGTRAVGVANSIGIPTFIGDNAVTVTNAANLYIAGPPAAGSNMTITNPWSLYVAAGNAYVAGNISGTTIGGITEANLVDKTASETISGTWEWGRYTNYSFGNDTYNVAPFIGFKRQRDGTPTSDVSDGDHLGDIRFFGYGSSAYQAGAYIVAVVDGTPGESATDMPTALQFQTTPDGSATPVTRLTIDSSGNVGITNAAITAGSGTGITVNHTGWVNQQVYKVTTTYAAYSDTDTTKGIVIATLPAKTKLIACYADTTAEYTGGAVSAATLRVGVTAEDAAEILADHDVLSGAVTKGLADADMGTSMTRAAAIQGGYLPSWTGTTAIYATINTTDANTNALTTGSTTFYLVTARY